MQIIGTPFCMAISSLANLSAHVSESETAVTVKTCAGHTQSPSMVAILPHTIAQILFLSITKLWQRCI
jgi:hypothetical protein